MRYFQEKLPPTPIAFEADLCVIGGSCTGVFAAVRAARLGLKVAVIEAHNCFGGVATSASVNIWHSLFDTQHECRIIAGLTEEVIQRLLKIDGAKLADRTQMTGAGCFLNTELLKIELDRLIVEHDIRPFLHARFVAPIVHEGTTIAVAIEDKSGRRAIAARYFIDASGDGDLVHSLQLPCYKDDALQPPTCCAKLQGLKEVRRLNPGFQLGKTVFDPKYPEALRSGFLWDAPVPGLKDIVMVAGTRVHGCDVSDADQLTHAEIEGREQVARMIALLRRHIPGGSQVNLVDLAGHIGSRESRHARCLYQITEQDVLYGRKFSDGVLSGSYRVDVHFPDREGLIFRYLNGVEEVFKNGSRTVARWREKTATDPVSYHLPLRSLIPLGSKNVMVAGRCLDADRGAFGALRVMVNCNQMGEAAGVTCALAAKYNCAVSEVDATHVRAALQAGGSIIPPWPEHSRS